MEEIEVPSHFLCPISMQLMRDPVTISTGITYDRESIHRWLISSKNNMICPVTKQVLPYHADLTPNHTLHRLIQSWSSTLNSSDHISPTPVPPQPVIDKSQMAKLINDAKKRPEMRLKCLRGIRSIVQESERGKLCFKASGGVEFVAFAMAENGYFNSAEKDEVVIILNHIELSDRDLQKLITISENGEFVEALLNVILVSRNSQSRVYAIILLQSIFTVSDPPQVIGLKSEFFVEMAEVMKDKIISQQATKAALKLLMELCPWGRNRVKAAESGLVFVLLDFLLDTSTERRVCELVLAVLDQLCRCAEGRAELLRHGAGLAIVSKKILRVSHGASDRAVKVLYSISRFSASPRVLQEMLQVGVVTKLCLVIQVESGAKTKERAKEILRLHSRVWKNSPCIPAHLLSSYPSS